MKGSKKQPQSTELSVPGIDLGQLERLLSFMSEHGLEEFEYAHGDLRIRLKKAAAPPSSTPGRALPAASETSAPQAPSRAEAMRGESAPVVAADSSAARPPSVPAEELHVIKSPIVGTFYAAPNPESGPFVKVGDSVQAGQTVCIIEAMKLMNEIEADISGEVARILVENGQPVEYGEPLFALRPTSATK
jgi:acetyl-CoA carboxylase biotin carboxyl carrier protein